MEPSRLAKFVAVLAISGGVGIAVGAGLSELSGGDSDLGGPVEPSESSTPAVPAAPADARVAQSSSAPAPGPRPAPTASTKPSVRVLDSVLHPAGTPDGQLRQRARLTVRVQATNRSTADLTPARPTLLVGQTSTATDPSADSPGTNLGRIGPGRSQSVTLRFEVAGAVTRQLITTRRAVIFVGGRSHPISIKLGNPVDTPVATRVPDE